MQSASYRQLLILLALMVGALPFSLGYAVTVDLPQVPHLSHQMIDHADCDQAAEQACADLQVEQGQQDSCCSDHCDPSSGTQLCTADQPLILAGGQDLYIERLRLWAAGPIPSTPLQPPR